MAQRSLRFAIRRGELRAATWKLWTETGGGQSDVYLACRSLGGALKVSLHESGSWHYAFSQKTFEDRVDGALPTLSNRFVEKWPRPPDLQPGITLAFRIVTPWSAVTTPIGTSGVTDIIWLPNAPENRAKEIDIFLTVPSTLVTGWPGKRSMNTSLIGSVLLENGETVWAVHWTTHMPDFSQTMKGTRFFKGTSRKDLESDGLRMLAFGNEADGSRVIYDCAVQGLAPSASGSA